MKAFRGPALDFRVSFLDPAFKKRIKQSITEKDLLRKALGPAKGLKILDATAGLCRESLRMAYWGHSVWSCERSQALCEHLKAAFAEASTDEFYETWISRITFVAQSTEDFLKQYSENFDVIVIDPMFPEEKRKALPKKDLQFLRTLVDSNDNSEFLLQSCLPRATKKLLLKRPLKAATLGNPIHSYTGRAHRWDSYAPLLKK